MVPNRIDGGNFNSGKRKGGLEDRDDPEAPSEEMAGTAMQRKRDGLRSLLSALPSLEGLVVL